MDAAAPQHLVHDGRQAEDVAATIPGSSRDSFGRRIRAPNGWRHTGAFERARHAEAGHARLVARQEEIARMQRAVQDVDDRREVERAGKLNGHLKGVRRRRGTVIADEHV